MSAEVRLITPRPEQAGDVMRVRAELFVDEFVSAGVDAEVVQRHVKLWGFQDNAKRFAESMRPFVEGPGSMFEIAEQDAAVRGIFHGYRAGAQIPRADRTAEGNELWLITLHRSLRGVPEQPRERRVSHRWMSRYLTEFGDPTAPTRLEVLQANSRALAFYRRWGFVIVSEEDMFVGGQLVPSYLMKRPPQKEMERSK